MGPWRLPLDNIAPATPPDLVPNPDTWLDFSDLVFVDPVGTGYSHFVATGEQVRKQFWSVDGDAAALAVFIRKWVEKYGRQVSSKFIVGESYGGFRAPKIATALQGDQGVGVSGLILISPVLDFAWRGQKAHSPLLWVSRLPSMAAAARKQPFDREVLHDVERYAAGDYLLDLLRGQRDVAAVERISARVAALTGLEPALVRELAGRIDLQTFQRELNRQHGLVTSIYDATITGLDPYPSSRSSRFSDPFLSAMTAPLTSAATALYQSKLGWKVDAPYHLLASQINSQWDWGRGRSGPDVVDDLRKLLAGDRQMRILVAHGASDLVTPYFENQLIMDQLPTYGSPERLKLMVYGGGHMFYSRDLSRSAFRTDAQRLFAARREE
jgi:carboxypeptidase C (cathepsin A)